MTTPYYQDEYVTLYHGDCREVTEWLSADVLVTDPPYGIGWTVSESPKAGRAAHPGIANDHDTSARDVVLEMWGDRPALVFGSFYAPWPERVRQVLIYRKPADAGVVGSTTGHRRDAEPIFLRDPWPVRTCAWSSVLDTGCRSVSALVKETGHPHVKPLDVMSDLVERSPGDVIADPFAGSGSTLIAAKTLGRRAIGVELDADYCRTIAARLGSTEHSVMHDGSLWTA